MSTESCKKHGRGANVLIIVENMAMVLMFFIEI